MYLPYIVDEQSKFPINCMCIYRRFAFGHVDGFQFKLGGFRFEVQNNFMPKLLVF